MGNRENRKRYRKAHPERVAAENKTWNARHRPDRAKYPQARRYGLTVRQVEAMFDFQEGRCAICNVTLDEFHIDHDHVTKKVRGLLCGKCNGGLGFFGDRISLLKAAVLYLEQRGEKNAV